MSFPPPPPSPGTAGTPGPAPMRVGSRPSVPRLEPSSWCHAAAWPVLQRRNPHEEVPGCGGVAGGGKRGESQRALEKHSRATEKRKEAGERKAKSLRHPVFPGGLPSKY